MHKNYKNLSLYCSKNLNSFPELIHGFAPYLENVTNPLDLNSQNKEAFIILNKEIDISDSQICLINQVHGNRVLVLKDSTDLKKFRTQDYDAIVTQEKKVLLGIRTADCIPLLFYDPKTTAIAAIHGGWRSTAQSIVVKTLNVMTENYGTLTKDVFVAIGPGICQRCFEVGADVAVKFSSSFLKTRGNDKYLLDLYAAHSSQLEEAGVPSTHIEVLNLCTFHNETQFFSYRRDKTSKRHLNFIMMRHNI